MKLSPGNGQLIRGSLEKINFIRLWIARALIGLVFLFNVQCAIAFILSPNQFLASFELEGTSGRVLIQGMGILFIMWNVPYSVAIVHPQKYQICLYCALLMQLIGLLGETLIFMSIPEAHISLISTARRFIYFDGFGLAVLALASLISRDFLHSDSSTLRKSP
jgi:hypothetical protein